MKLTQSICALQVGAERGNWQAAIRRTAAITAAPLEVIRLNERLIRRPGNDHSWRGRIYLPGSWSKTLCILLSSSSTHRRQQPRGDRHRCEQDVFVTGGRLMWYLTVLARASAGLGGCLPNDSHSRDLTLPATDVKYLNAEVRPP